MCDYINCSFSDKFGMGKLSIFLTTQPYIIGLGVDRDTEQETYKD